MLPLLAAGCTEPVTEEVGGTLTLVAMCPQTRTVNSGMTTTWQNNDRLSVFAEDGGAFTNNRFNYTGNYSFSGQVSNLQEVSVLYAVYPYTEQWTSPAHITVDVPSSAVQNGNDDMGHLAGTSFPLYGTCRISQGTNKPSFAMNQLLAVAKFNITNGDFYVGCAPFDATGDFDVTIVADSNGDEVVSSKTVTGKTIELTAGTITTLNYTFTPLAPEETYMDHLTLSMKTWVATWLLLICGIQIRIGFASMNLIKTSGASPSCRCSEMATTVTCMSRKV